MAQVEMPNILGSFLSGQQAGQEQRRKRTLSEFIQPALSGDKSALAQVYAADAGTGLQVQGLAQKQAATDRETKVAQWQQAARLFPNAPQQIKDQLYSQIVSLTEELGVAPAGSLPRQHDPALDANFSKFLASIAGAEDGYTLAPGSKRFDNNNQLVAEAPFQPASKLYVGVPTGDGGEQKMLYDPRSGTFSMPNYNDLGPAIGAPSSNHQDNYADIAARHGSVVTSGVRPVLPGVGAGANSQHPKGTAADFRTNGLKPEQVQGLINDLRKSGYEVIDERDNRNGRGPHIHAELPPGAQLGRTPPKSEKRDAPSGYQWAGDGQSLIPIPGGPADRKNNPAPADLAKAEMSLRKELTDRIKEPRAVLGMFQKVQAAAQQPSAANDLAMIFAYMKMLDPGSVVREQEFANAQNAAGVPDQVRNAWNKALRGERLNESQRQQFVSSAAQIAGAANQQITNTTREYQGLADQYGYDAGRATGMADFRDVQSSSSSATSAAPGSAAGWAIKVKP